VKDRIAEKAKNIAEKAATTLIIIKNGADGIVSPYWRDNFENVLFQNPFGEKIPADMVFDRELGNVTLMEPSA
jgi:hypothetical protein